MVGLCILLMDNKPTYYFLPMSKSRNRQYHLAVSFTRYPSLKQLALPHPHSPLPTHHPLLNIFNDNFEIRLRKLEMEQRRNYEVVGYKEVQDISLRLERKKRMVESGTSGPKHTFHSRSSNSNQSQDYLTKEEVVRFCSPHFHHLTSAATSRSNGLTAPNSPSKHNKQPTITTKRSKKSEGPSLHKSAQFSLAKLKTRMEEYKCGWRRQIENKRKLTKRPHHQASSVIESVDQFRNIAQDRQKLALEEKLSNISPSMWEKILRFPKNSLATSMLSGVRQVASSGKLKNVGRGKYEKQLQWLQEKDKRGYFFKKDKGFPERQALK